MTLSAITSGGHKLWAENGMAILYFGDPQGVLKLLEDGVDIVGIVHGRVGGPGWRRLFEFLSINQVNIPRWRRPDLNDPKIIEALGNTSPNLLVSCFYPDLIPPDLLALAPGLNVHPSDLPQWRGPDPIIHTILSGQTQTAICVHELTQALDAGDIYERSEIDVSPTSDAGSLSEALEAQGAEMIAAFASNWLKDGPKQATSQTGIVTWAPQRDEDWWEIDWTRSAIDIERFIRAAYPHPGAYTGIGDELLVIQKASVAMAGQFDSLVPGSPFTRDDAFFIKCGVDALCLHWLKLGRRRMRGRDFARLLH